MHPSRRAKAPLSLWAAATLPLLPAFLLLPPGCRSATIVKPLNRDTQTVITVEEHPKTQPSDKDLIVIDED